MKKEWILNEEQLRRRKNSRLNHMQSRTMQNGGVSSGGVGSGTGSTSTANSISSNNKLNTLINNIATPNATPCKDVFFGSFCDHF